MADVRAASHAGPVADARIPRLGVLPNLTAEDIKALGIATVGHRRKLLDAIALLHAGADAPPSSTSLPTAPVAAAATAEAAEERRHS